MSVVFYISGGELRFDKKIFIKEMLRPDSAMKLLLNYRLEDQDKTRSLKVDKSSADQVVIDFNSGDNVAVGEDYQKLLEGLKKDLKGRMTGNITLTANAHFGFMYLSLDFNSGDGSIKHGF